MTVATPPPADPPTEGRNPRTTWIDLVPTRAILGMLNSEDQLVPTVVASVLGTLAQVVDEAAERVRGGGSVHYFGAGSSGRIAVLDAAELVPTFGTDPATVTAHLAGGDSAVTRAVEGVEDDTTHGHADASAVGAGDLVIGLSASGRTPYVAGALSGAAERGAFTVLLTCNPRSTLAALARVSIVADTGPEAIAGSTRLKATSALKLILNGFSTALMVRLGKTYSNLMVEVNASNSKLRARLIRILAQATGLPAATCEAELARADGDVKLAMVSLLSGAGTTASARAMAAGDGSVRSALGMLRVLDGSGDAARADGALDRADRGGTPAGRAAAGRAARGGRPRRGEWLAARMGTQPGVLRALAARAQEIAALAPPAPAGVLIFGRGSSGHAARYGADLFSGTRIDLDGPAAAPRDRAGYLAIAVSSSGQAPDVVATLRDLRRAGATCIAVTNAPRSDLAATADRVLDLAAGGSTTLTAKMLALALLARAPGSGVVADAVQAVLDDPPPQWLASKLSTAWGVVGVASGRLRVAADETALRFTRSAAILSACYPASELGHLSADMLRPGLAVIGFGDRDAGPDWLAEAGRHVLASGADWIEIAPGRLASHGNASHGNASGTGITRGALGAGTALGIPADLPPYALPIVAVARGQQLAWSAALLSGRDPQAS